MARETDTDRPQLTVWTVEICHGLLPTEAGQLGGWGWICHAHINPEGFHGYPDEEAMVGHLLAHMMRCPGRG